MGELGVENFQTTFAVPLHCDSCVNEVSSAVKKVEGVTKIEARLEDQLVLVEGTTAPSKIVAAIEATGRDAILRGSGKSDSAAVCILETHSTAVPDQVRGLARMVEIAPNKTLVDLTIRGLPAGRYQATVRETGDISRGAASTGGIWEALMDRLGISQQPRGLFGAIEIGQGGRGSAFMEQPVGIWEIIGRSMVVSQQEKEGRYEQDDANTLVGVIARSAGVWDNDKTVCSCSGKSVWEERKEQVDRGMH